MNESSKLGKVLRTIGLILLGLTAFFHLMGGIGTSCVAFGAEKYDSMTGIVPFKWLYQLFVVVTIAIAVYAIRATVNFGKAKQGSYRLAIIILVIGLVVSTIHVIASRMLRGNSMPNDARVYMNALTLIVFALFYLKGARQALGLDRPGDGEASGGGIGAAFVLMGFISLTVHLFAGPTHTWNGINYADVWHTELQFAGWGLVLLGIGWIAVSVLKPAGKLAELPMEG